MYNRASFSLLVTTNHFAQAKTWSNNRLTILMSYIIYNKNDFATGEIIKNVEKEYHRHWSGSLENTQ